MPALRDLDRAECERLLRGSNFGRVVLVTPERPEIVPVNYVVRAGSIVIRTSPTGILARHAEGAELLFEVDRVDDEYWSGWSVVARGPGHVVTDPPTGIGELPRVRPWADGDRSAELHLQWTELTGRQVGVAWDAAGALFSRRTAR